MNLLVKFYSSSEKWLKIKNQSSKLDYYAPSYLTHTVIWSNFPKEFFVVKVQKKKKTIIISIYLPINENTFSFHVFHRISVFFFPPPKHNAIESSAKPRVCVSSGYSTFEIRDGISTVLSRRLIVRQTREMKSARNCRG